MILKMDPMKISLRGVPWLSLYRVQDQATYKEIGSPDQAVVSLREEN